MSDLDNAIKGLRYTLLGVTESGLEQMPEVYDLERDEDSEWDEDPDSLPGGKDYLRDHE
jgi:hypothetical protein